MINSFSNRYNFLSNFYPVGIVFEGIRYPSVEHAYQAAKTLSEVDRITISHARYAGQAKSIGRRVKLRENWDEIRLDVMLTLLREKFKSPKLATRLLLTKDEELVEENYWNDTFWGVCKGVGENHLGKLLMQVREELKNEPKAV